MTLDRTWYNTLVNDDGSNTVGSVWDKADVGQVMTEVDKTQVCCSVFITPYMDFGSGVWAPITFAGEDFDTWNMHAPSGSRITVPYSGVYAVSAQLGWPPHATGVRGISLLLNGVTVHPGYLFVKAFADGAQGPMVSLTVLWTAAAGSYLELQAYQNSGITQRIDPGGRLAVWRIS